MDADPVYQGLLRKPKFLGLPVLYGMLWLLSGILLFIWTKSLLVLAYVVISYPVLYLSAAWDPNFIDVVFTSLQTTRPTLNKKLWNGHSYEP